MPTLLHLYPGEVRARRELLTRQREWLRERRIRLVLADDWIAESDRDLYDDCLEIPPAEEVGATFAKLLEHAKAHRFDGILAQSEAAVPAGSLLIRELALPGPAPLASLRTVGKHLTRQTLAAAGVPQPGFTIARDAADVRRFGDANGWPVVLKAFSSTMSRLVTRLDRHDQVETGVARVLAGLQTSKDVARLLSFAKVAELDAGPDARTHFLCETFAPGDPVETDGFVVAGKARSFGVIEQRMTEEPLLYIEAYLLPSDRSDAERAAIQDVGERATEALGLDAAGFSAEMRAEGGWKPGTPAARLIEVNGRLGEDDGLHRLFELACGADPFHLAVELALGGKPDYERRATPRRAVAYRCSFTEGTIASVPSQADFASLGVEAGPCVRVGDVMHAPPHPETFPHVAWALAADEASSQAAFEKARALLVRLHFELVQSAAS